MRTLIIRHLPLDATDNEVSALFGRYGKVFSVKLARDMFNGTCRGFGKVEMEGHEARAAMAALNGKFLRGNSLLVQEDRAPWMRDRRRYR